MISPDLAFWTSIGAAAVSVSAAVAAARWAALSLPIGVRKALTDLAQRVEGAEATVQGLAGKWHAKALELEDTLEALGDLEDSIERKRRRVAASASKIAQHTAPDESQTAPQDLDEVRRRARARGIAV